MFLPHIGVSLSPSPLLLLSLKAVKKMSSGEGCLVFFLSKEKKRFGNEHPKILW